MSMRPAPDDERERITRFVTAGGYARAVATVRAVCGNGCDAEDAVQEALAQALSQPDIRELGPWVATVAINNARQSLRRDARRRELQAQLADDRPENEPAVHDDVIRSLRALPDRQREVVVLHYYWDASVADIAALLSVSQGAVKVHLWRARARLQSELNTNLEIPT
jgi:RNA polymerase sigma-70 factor, ECF subfamily